MNDLTKSAKISVVSIRVIRVPVVSILGQNKVRSASPRIFFLSLELPEVSSPAVKRFGKMWRDERLRRRSQGG